MPNIKTVKPSSQVKKTGALVSDEVIAEMMGRLDYSLKLDPRKEWEFLEHPLQFKTVNLPEGFAFNLLGDTRRHLLKSLGFSGIRLDCMQDIFEALTRASKRSSGHLKGKITRKIDRGDFLFLNNHNKSTFQRTIAQARSLGILEYRNLALGKGLGSQTHYWLTDSAHVFFHLWAMVTNDLPKHVRRSGRLFESMQRRILPERIWIRDIFAELEDTGTEPSTIYHWIRSALMSVGDDYRAGQTIADIATWHAIYWEDQNEAP